MKQGTKGEAAIHVDVPPEQLYALVTDVARMGEWSPETYKTEWLDGATGPAVGARFKGSNRRGLARWSTKPRVVAAEPGREFAFVTELRGKEHTKWTYRFEPEDGGTKVTESFEMMVDSSLALILIDKLVLRVPDRRADLIQGMQTTLGRIKAAAERAATATT